MKIKNGPSEIVSTYCILERVKTILGTISILKTIFCQKITQTELISIPKVVKVEWFLGRKWTDFNIDMVCETVFLHFFIIKVLTFGLSFNNGTVHAVSEFVFSNNLKFILGTGSQIMDFNFSCIWRIDW